MGGVDYGFYVHPMFAVLLLIAVAVIVGGAVLFAKWVTRER